MDLAVRFFVHPNVWIRESAVHLVATVASHMSSAERLSILGALKDPIPMNVWEAVLFRVTNLQNGTSDSPSECACAFSFAEQRSAVIDKGDLGSVTDYSTFNRANDDARWWVKRLKVVGLTQEDEYKVFCLKGYIANVAERRSMRDRDDATGLGATIVMRRP
ncbi:Serine/threonine-protein kinase [Ascosphaera atra]|nr:Serine/threonine-protein kinase [Ascosphaera atra]